MPTLTEEVFQKTVLDGIETQKKNYDTLAGQVQNYSAETKKSFEDLKKATNENAEKAGQAIARVDALQRREARMAFGNPIKRIQADPELRGNLNAVFRLMIAGKDPNFKLPDMYKDYVKDFAQIEQRAVGEDTTPGSTYLRTELLREIYDTLALYGKWNTLGVRRMGTKLTRLPVKTARPTASWITTEAGSIADDTNVAGAEVTLQVYPNAVLLNVSRQVIDDALFDVSEIVLNDFVQAFNQRLDQTAFAGDGSNNATYGGMTGIFNYWTAAVAANGNVTAAGLQLEDFMRTLLAVDPIVLERPGTAWWLHPQMLVRLLGVKDKNGRPLFLNALEAPTPAGIGSILGYPVHLCHAAPNTDGAGKTVAAFGDPDSLVVGIREDFGFEATDAYRWNTYERSFRGVGRAGVKGRIATGGAVLTTAAN